MKGKSCGTAAPARPRNTNYDGYYNDVNPIDADRGAGNARDKPDKELITRIALIAVGAGVLIAASIILMVLL